MAHYSINTIQQASGSSNGIVIIPLVLVTIFCFGFVAMKPAKPSKLAVSATNPVPAAAPVPSQLPPIQFASSDTLPTLSQAPDTSENPIIASPQVSVTSASSLQTASTNDNHSGQPMTVSLHTLTIKLTNLLTSKSSSKTSSTKH